ncbi:MAG: ATP-binding protein [Thermoplasmata archaeon]
MATELPPYEMGVTLNVLEHLGLNLYSNIPAVLSEVVANSWDADADHVWIAVAADGSSVTIEDDGRGMNRVDVNRRYLAVGFRRREDKSDPGARITQKWKRPVMGRKGIGKLSLFSIANTVDVYTTDGTSREALRLSAEEIRRKIAEDEKKNPGAAPRYLPTPLPEWPADWPLDRKSGTRTVVSELKGSMHGDIALRKRLARRFSIIGAEHNFEVIVDGKPVTVADREYWNRIQFIWHYGPKGAESAARCTEAAERQGRPGTVSVRGKSFEMDGWIGSVEESTDLKDGKDNLNKILLMVRNKVAEEDLLDRFPEGGVYTKYLIGELHADFLDNDDLRDIATSGRQRIIEDDPRFEAVLEFVRKELKNIENTWTDLRGREGVKTATKEFPPIKRWYDSLKPDQQNMARALLGRVYKSTAGSLVERRELIKHVILGFETLSLRGELSQLEKIGAADAAAVAKIIGHLDGIDATLYYSIVKERLEIIKALRTAVDDNEKEKVIQRHIYDHLWLLSPGWDRATDLPQLEARVTKGFEAIDAALKDEEKSGRVDIRYRRTSGTHVIVELKRPEVRVTTAQILSQVRKYQRALREVLQKEGRGDEPAEVVCILGDYPSDWDHPDDKRAGERALTEYGIRVVLYDKLIAEAYEQYREYFEKHEEKGLIFAVVKELDSIQPAG